MIIKYFRMTWPKKIDKDYDIQDWVTRFLISTIPDLTCKEVPDLQSQLAEKEAQLQDAKNVLNKYIGGGCDRCKIEDTQEELARVREALENTLQALKYPTIYTPESLKLDKIYKEAMGVYMQSCPAEVKGE